MAPRWLKPFLISTRRTPGTCVMRFVLASIVVIFASGTQSPAQERKRCIEVAQQKIYGRLEDKLFVNRDSIRQVRSVRAVQILRQWLSQQPETETGACEVLAYLLTLNDVGGSFTEQEKALLGELYAVFSDFSKAAKATNNPELKAFYKACDKLDRGSPTFSSQYKSLIRQGNDRVLLQVTSTYLKRHFAKQLAEEVLGSDAFLRSGTCPGGLDASDFGYEEGLKEVFLKAWGTAWLNGSVPWIQNLIAQRSHFLQESEVTELKNVASAAVLAQPDLAYRLAESSFDFRAVLAPPMAEEILLKRRVLEAKRSGNDLKISDHATALSESLRGPRDCYEAASVALKTRNETLLGALNQKRETLLQYHTMLISQKSVEDLADQIAAAFTQVRDTRTAQENSERRLTASRKAEQEAEARRDQAQQVRSNAFADLVSAITNRCAYEIALALDPQAPYVMKDLTAAIQKAKAAEATAYRRVREQRLGSDPEFRAMVQAKVNEGRALDRLGPAYFGTLAPAQQRGYLVYQQVTLDLNKFLKEGAGTSKQRAKPQ